MIIREKNPKIALEMFNAAPSKFPSYRHNAPAYAAMIDALASANLVDKMKSVIEEMKRDSCELRDSMMAGIIRSYGKLGRAEEAVALFREIPHLACAGSAESLTAILEVLIMAGEAEKAWEVFSEGKVEVRSLNLIMAELCRRRRADLAMEVFSEFSEMCLSPDEGSYEVLMRGLCEEGRLDEAKHLLYGMLRRISRRGCGGDVVAHKILLEALAAEGAAEEIIAKVLKKGLRSPASRRRFEGGRVGSVVKALVGGGGGSAAAYGGAAAELYREGRTGEAEEVVEEMGRRGFRAGAEVYEARVAALCREGRAEEAAAAAAEMPTAAVRARLVEGLCGGGRTGTAEERLRGWGAAAGKEAWEAAVRGCCREGRFAAAGRVVERMARRGLWPETETLEGLIVGLARAGQVFDAVLWLEEMVARGRRPSLAVWAALVARTCSS